MKQTNLQNEKRLIRVARPVNEKIKVSDQQLRFNISKFFFNWYKGISNCSLLLMERLVCSEI